MILLLSVLLRRHDTFRDTVQRELQIVIAACGNLVHEVGFVGGHGILDSDDPAVAVASLPGVVAVWETN